MCLTIGIGVGLSSCTYFLWLFFVGPPGKLFHVCELAAFATAGLVGFVLVRACSKFSEKPQSVSLGLGRWHTFLVIAFVADLVLSAFGAIGAYFNEPLGEWDAWAIWNLRARLLFNSGEQWRQAFSPIFQHPDYPLLIPANNARFWSYLGMDYTWTPWLLGCIFTFATVGILVASVSRLRSQSQGLLAGLVLLGMVPFLRHGTSQYADVPLAFFILSAVLLLAIYDASERSHWGLLALSGLAAGLAAWTKNEGLLFMFALTTSRCAVVWRRDCGKMAFAQLLCWCIGLLPGLVVIAIQKAYLSGSNDLLSGQNWTESMTRLSDPSRYWHVIQAFILYALRVSRPFAVVLPLAFLMLGMAKKRSPKALGIPTALTLLTLMLAGYFLVYITTPHDLHWHLASSTERLLLHLCPLCIFIMFLCLATPEELLAKDSCAHRPHKIAFEPISVLQTNDKSAGVAGVG
jgi:hypothetical protein